MFKNQGPGKGHIIKSETQKNIISDYNRSDPKLGIRALGRKYNLPHSTVGDLRSRFKGGTVVTLKGHKKRKLSPEAEVSIIEHLDHYPTATNVELAQLVNDVVCPQTISKILARANPPFVMRRILNREPAEYLPEWKEEVSDFIHGTLRRIRIEDRIYADESAIFTNEAKRFGRTRLGKPILQSKSRYGKKFTLHIAISRDKILCWSLREVNANDQEVVKFGLRIAKKMSKGQVLLWDRLGRSGRSKNPVAQHFNPLIIQAINAKGGQMVHLPPLRKYLDPVELLFNDLKEHYIRPAHPPSGHNFSEDELRSLICTYVAKMTPQKLQGFYGARTNGHWMTENGLLDP